MSISKLFKSIVVASVLAATSFAANATTINFSFNQKGVSTQYGSGNFTGTDLNHDGFLTQNELTTFNGFITQDHVTVNLANLFQFSAFNLATDVWTESPLATNPGLNVWFSWNNGGYAIFDRNFALTTSVVSKDATVPEPASIALFGLGLLGFAAARRRKHNM